MNAPLQILLTALIVGAGIGGYHFLTTGAPTDVLVSAAPEYERSIAALEKRVKDLEERGPVLQGSVDAQALWEQLRRLADRVDAMEQNAPVAAAHVTADLVEPAADPSAVDPTAGAGDVTEDAGAPSPLTRAEEERVRELFDDTLRDRMQQGMSRRLDRTLSELGIELTEEQRKKLDETVGGHMQSLRETMRKAREEGVPREERRALVAPLNEQLTEKISEFLPVGDAAAITSALSTMGRGPGGMGGGPGGGPGRR